MRRVREEDSYFLIALEQFLQQLRPGEIYTAATLKVYHRRSGGGVSFAARAPTYSLHPLVCVCSPGTGVVHYARGAVEPGVQSSSQKESKFLSVWKSSLRARDSSENEFVMSESEMRRPVAKCATLAPLLASARRIKFLVPTIMLQIARAHFIFSQRGGYKVDSGEDGAHWQVHEALHMECAAEEVAPLGSAR